MGIPGIPVVQGKSFGNQEMIDAFLQKACPQRRAEDIRCFIHSALDAHDASKKPNESIHTDEAHKRKPVGVCIGAIG